MPKARKRKIPITAGSDSSSSSNPNSSRTLIRKFHVLLKKQAQLQKQRHAPEDAKALTDVEHEIEEMGGLSAYQRMSSIGQSNDRGGGSEKVLISWLKALGVSDRKEKPKLGYFVLS